MDEKKMYTPQKIADYLGVKVDTVWSWIRAGKLRAHVVAGRLYRVSEKQLENFLGNK